MEKVLITEVCDILVGRTPSRYNPVYWGTGFPWLSIADMNQGDSLSSTKETITTEAVKECNCKQIPKGTVLFSFKLSIGKVGITAVDMFTNEAIAAFLIKDKSRLDTKFLFYTLKSTDYSVGSNKAVMGKTLNKEQLKKFTIPLPSIEEQLRIVKILDLAQSLIEKRRQAIAYLDDYIKTVFLDMFGDPVSNPKGWEVVKFEDICKIETEQISPIKIKSSHYYIGLEDIEKGTGRIIKTSSSNSALLKSAKFVFTKENVLYGKLRPYLNKVALPEREGICSTDILPLTPIKDKSQKHFICYLIRSDYFVSQMIKCTVGANLPRVNSGSLNETSVYSPPIALQGQFSEIVQKTESLQQKMQSQLQELEHNFQAQLQRAFRGE